MSQTLTNIIRTKEPIAPSAALHIEVIADLICPFCFLGKRRLDAALRAVKGPSDVTWYPWQLNPEMPQDGVEFDSYLSSRFGPPATIEPVLDSLRREGKAEGIEFRFDRIKRVPNTMKSHLLMYLAETEGKDQMALADDLMSAFFEHGKDIGDVEFLQRIAGRHGLSVDEVARVFEDENAKQVVMTREAQVRSSGIAGVPGYLLNRRLLMIGAQETDAMINAFDRAMFGEGTDLLVSPALH